MNSRPLPIPGLPLAQPAPGPRALQDVIPAASPEPAPPLAPLPTRTAAAPAAAVMEGGRSSRTYPHGELPPTQHRPRLQPVAAVAKATAPAAAPVATPAASATTSAVVAPAPPASPATATPVRVAAHVKDEFALFPVRRNRPANPRAATPRLEPIRTQAFAYHRHPLAIRTPLDVVRFFPMTVSASAALVGVSGFLAGKIVNHTLGGALTPALFVVGYLALFLLNLLTHYFSSKGQLFFSCSHRFQRLLAVTALLLSPHFIAYSILVSLAEK